MNLSHGILVTVGIIIGVILAMVYNYMSSSKENLDIPSIEPDIPSISPEEQQAILDGGWSDFKDWIDKNIKESDKESDKKYVKNWEKVDEKLEKELTQDDGAEKTQ